MRISCLVAVGKNGVMGRDGTLPWKIPSDLALFKVMTFRSPLIMGRKTWDSLPRRPLPGRPHIVLTHNTKWTEPGALAAHTWQSALTLAQDQALACRTFEVFVIGGAELFAHALKAPEVTTVYRSDVDLAPQGNVLFPPLDPRIWRLIYTKSYPKTPLDDAAFSWRVFKKNSP